MRNRQSGIALVLFVIGLLAVLAMAGLALDTGHLVLQKSRLQNVVDAAALTAAKVLDQTGDTAGATAAAQAAFDRNASENGGLSGMDVAVEYSRTLQPFVSGTTPVRYVRVRAENLTWATDFIRVLGVTSLTNHASAVAGPTPLSGPGAEVCDLLPMLACGDPGAGAPNWGIAAGQLVVLKVGAGSNPGAVGPGNFQLLDAGSGANDVRDALAGKPWGTCESVGDVVVTKPGDVVSIRKGLNTRFDSSRDSLYPPDVIRYDVASATGTPLTIDRDTGAVMHGATPVTNVSQIGYSHDASYEPRIEAGQYDNPPPAGMFRRREITVPIGVCTGGANGVSNVDVLGFGCFFLLQPVSQGGQQSYVVAEFIHDCTTHGTPGGGGGGSGGPNVIQLYRDYTSNDS